MKSWFKSVISPYFNDDNLIDVKYDTEVLVEIRTDGYDNIVTNTNILIADTLYKIVKYCKINNDPDEEKVSEKAKLMTKSINELLWDEKNWWFSNLDVSGNKKIFMPIIYLML